ncbi:MAG: acetate/propionate family kinase [Betaproteobacteria bacterium]
MTAPARRTLLTINTGSSSLKTALYATQPALAPVAGIEFVRIGIADGNMRVTAADGATLADTDIDVADHDAALHAVFTWLDEQQMGAGIVAVGHRIVHGGSGYSDPQPVTPELMRTLEALVPQVPNHLPQAIAALAFIARLKPGLQQVACFDTAFHRRMPRVAQMYALPRRYFDSGVLRYGFHGLSYEYIVDQLRRLDPVLAAGRVIIAHLGNGASMAAVNGGIGIDTTMGFTPTSGLVMGTRSGDVDPGLLLYLLENERMTTAALKRLLNHESGLLGVSGTTPDMRDLLAAEATDARAAEAVALFCYRARQYVGAFAASLNGLDGLVFTGGIGEKAAPVRERICRGLDFLGIAIDDAQNTANAAVISTPASRVAVRVIRTNEELTIARHTAAVVAAQSS